MKTNIEMSLDNFMEYEKELKRNTKLEVLEDIRDMVMQSNSFDLFLNLLREYIIEIRNESNGKETKTSNSTRREF